MATSFGQDMKNASRLTAKQLEMLDDVYAMDEGASIYSEFPMGRTLGSLFKRGYVDHNGITDEGRNALYAHI